MPRPVIHIPNGTKFGRLTVLSSYQTEPNTPWRCVVSCECGNQKEINKSNLLNGNANSCGCLKNELSSARWTKHGHSKVGGKRSPTYTSWHAMWDRIRHPKPREAKTYGNLYIDPRWEEFANFLADMGERPEGKTIDRIDNAKGYYKDNCRWATPFEQVMNRKAWKVSPEGRIALAKNLVAARAAQSAKRAAKEN